MKISLTFLAFFFTFILPGGIDRVVAHPTDHGDLRVAAPLPRSRRACSRNTKVIRITGGSRSGGGGGCPMCAAASPCSAASPCAAASPCDAALSPCAAASARAPEPPAPSPPAPSPAPVMSQPLIQYIPMPMSGCGGCCGGGGTPVYMPAPATPMVINNIPPPAPAGGAAGMGGALPGGDLGAGLAGDLGAGLGGDLGADGSLGGDLNGGLPDFGGDLSGGNFDLGSLNGLGGRRLRYSRPTQSRQSVRRVGRPQVMVIPAPPPVIPRIINLQNLKPGVTYIRPPSPQLIKMYRI